jgi:imidazolonepropionase-like amidohydrolase
MPLKLTLALTLIPVAALRAQEPDVIAIQVGRAITVSGEEIEGATLLIKDGRLQAVGADIEAPWNARVLKLPRAVAMPGLISCHSTVGLRVPNENVPNVPYISVLDGIDPAHPAVKSSLRDGIAVAHVIPGSATRLGGQGAVVRLAGKTIAEMAIAAPSAMKISLQPAPAETRLSNMAALRRTFFDAYQQAREVLASAAPAAALASKSALVPSLEALVAVKAPWDEIDWDKMPWDRVDPQLRPMLDVVRGKLPVFLHCPTASDVFKAFELIDANRLRATLVLGRDAYKLADVLKARQDLGPVVLDDDFVTWEADPDTGVESRHVTPRVLFDAGIRFAVVPADPRDRGPGFSRDGELHLWYQAAQLVRFGIPRQEALKAVTLTPARILGLEHRLGSLEVGKDATISIFSGDPLDARSWVDMVFIEGKEVYRREKDRDLELLLREPERAF